MSKGKIIGRLLLQEQISVDEAEVLLKDEKKETEGFELCNCPACKGTYIISSPFSISPNTDFYETCPCNPKNGGSGICNCILSGSVVTYSVVPNYDNNSGTITLNYK